MSSHLTICWDRLWTAGVSHDVQTHNLGATASKGLEVIGSNPQTSRIHPHLRAMHLRFRCLNPRSLYLMSLQCTDNWRITVSGYIFTSLLCRSYQLHPLLVKCERNVSRDLSNSTSPSPKIIVQEAVHQCTAPYLEALEIIAITFNKTFTINISWSTHLVYPSLK